MKKVRIRKTLSLPIELVEVMQEEAILAGQSVSSLIRNRLASLFLPKTVGQFNYLGNKLIPKTNLMPQTHDQKTTILKKSEYRIPQ